MDYKELKEDLPFSDNGTILISTKNPLFYCKYI
jgi:hypothetical protein